jgi:hypothetical protein
MLMGATMSSTFLHPRRLVGALLGVALLAMTATAFAACPPANLQFGTGSITSVGTGPAGGVTADFDGDGILDLAVTVSHLTAGTYPGEVAILRGNGSGGVGNGTFAGPVTYAAGTTPLYIVTGDFTGDGILDLVVSNETGSTLSLLRGLGTGGVGNGTFGPPSTINSGSHPHHIATADLNGDGILDLAAADNAASNMSVMLGLGAGAFAAPVLYATNSYGTGICIADLNGDGIRDLAVTEYGSGSVALLMGNGSGGIGNGTFQAATHVVTGGNAYGVTAADLNGDGRADLLVGRDNDAGLVLYLGHGDGTFGAPAAILSGSVGCTDVADYDGDGFADIACTQATQNQVTLLHGAGDGSFTVRSQRATGSFPVYFANGDFNHDGARDAACMNYVGGSVSVFLSTCTTLPPTFVIDRVRDVPNDQGGKLWVTWPAHLQDVAGGSITGYRVWRRIPAAYAAAAGARGALRTIATATTVQFWEAAAVLPAQRLEAYGYTAATAQDSLAGSNPYTAFFVTATTSSTSLYYDTPVDSGYSVDNLAPAAPTQVQAEYNGALTMVWAPNAEADLYGYRVHRGADRFFTPTIANLVGQPATTHFTDADGAGWFYKVAAVDVHGNVGAFTLVEPNGPVGIEIALVSFEVTAEGVTLDWYADAHTVPLATLQRDEGDGDWQDIGTGEPDAGGRLVFHDTSVVPGATYRYRLQWSTAEGERVSSASFVTIPGLALALNGAWPNPATGGELAIRFTLPGASHATLALFDVAGRRVVQREVGSLGAGSHVLDLRSARLAPGLYLARLAQGGQLRSARVVVIP